MKRSSPVRKSAQTGADGRVLIGGGGGVNHNEALCTILKEMGKMEKAEGQRFKWKAYFTACDSLRSLDHAVKSGDEARQLPGIGAKIAAKIDEILATGKLHQLEDRKDDPVVRALTTFTNVSGIGPVHAHKYVDAGYRTLQDLLGSDEPLTEHQRIGIKHYDDLLEKIPRDEVAALSDIVRATAKRIDRRLRVETCGSYRRGLAKLGDVDCLLTHPVSSSTSGEKYVYLRLLTKALADEGVLVDVISEGMTKVMGVCRLPADTRGEPAAKRLKLSGGGEEREHIRRARRIDIRWVPADCFPTALLYFTGSGIFNTTLRAHALTLGYTLSEYGLFTVSAKDTPQKRIPVTCERDVFNALNVKYVEPHERCM